MIMIQVNHQVAHIGLKWGIYSGFEPITRYTTHPLITTYYLIK